VLSANQRGPPCPEDTQVGRRVIGTFFLGGGCFETGFLCIALVILDLTL
jgi:hypothetical protein